MRIGEICEVPLDKIFCPFTGLQMLVVCDIVDAINQNNGVSAEQLASLGLAPDVASAQSILNGMSLKYGFWLLPNLFVLHEEYGGASHKLKSEPHVYFIQCGKNGPIKIGIAGSVQSRLDNLQTANPVQLILLATIAHGGAALENHLHKRFAHLNIRNEWFQPAPELLAFIAKECQHV